MLGFLVVCVAVLSPVLRGSLDLGVQTSVQIFVLSGTLLWLAFRIFSGTVPIPPSRYLLWIFLLFILSGMSRMLSPIHALSDPSWFNLLLGFWILAVVPLISEEKREWLHRGMPFAGWVLFAVAFYQKFLEHQQFPYAAFLNPNVFAGFILMLLPFFMEKKRWVLSLCLLWALFWTGSKGAWLCLALVLVLYHSGRRGFLFWTGLFLGFFWTAMILGDLKSPGVLHRLLWWEAAWGMIQDRPWMGFGPGAYGYVFPAYHHPFPGGISSLYAHNYFLEIFAEYGIFFCLFWLGGVFYILSKIPKLRKLALWSILLHSFMDYDLSVPSVFWFFCTLLAGGMPQQEKVLSVPNRLKIPVLIFLGLGGFQLCRWIYDKPRVLSDSPIAYMQLSVERWQEYASRKEPHLLLESIAFQEEALRLNPYRDKGWLELAGLYHEMGRGDLAQDAVLRGQKYYPQLLLRSLKK